MYIDILLLMNCFYLALWATNFVVIANSVPSNGPLVQVIYMYVCIYIYIYTHIYTYIYVY